MINRNSNHVASQVFANVTADGVDASALPVPSVGPRTTSHRLSSSTCLGGAEGMTEDEEPLMEAGRISVTGTSLYTAELIQEGSDYRLVVTDRQRQTVQTAYVPRAMVERLPAFLTKLNSSKSGGFPWR
ncbi:hypothetical protein AB0L47_24520 [Streptomyces bobili]|uniref:hypothetical protein n=1 Tax=Streptomyces bobili TaxID=67280 RepID=UPI0034138C2A